MSEPRPRGTDTHIEWAVLERNLRDEDLELLQHELSLRMPWAYNFSEYVVGYRNLEPGSAEKGDLLRVVRRLDERHLLMPGVNVELITCAPELQSRWDELREQCVEVFGRLVTQTPPTMRSDPLLLLFEQ